MSSKLLLILLLAGLSLSCHCQGYVSFGYLPSSGFKDVEGNKHGSGGMQRISGQCSFPLASSTNERGQPKTWSVALSASYARMYNEGEAHERNPDRIVNASLSLIHLHPLSERWSLLASLGGGVYAMPDDVRWHSLLASGAFIFAYRLRENLSIGVGGGVTNSYGVPVIMPMVYLHWQTNGRYKVVINLSNTLKMQVATQVGKALRLELTAMEMDGLAAVVRVDDKQKLYSSALIRSGVNASFRLGGNVSLCTGVGGVWLRSSEITDRNLKSFFRSLGDDNKEQYRFAPSLYLSAGFRYGF